MSTHNLLVLSDVHLGSDLVHCVRPDAPHRDGTNDDRDRQLSALFDWYREHRERERPWKLVIAGDFVDFVGMSVSPAGTGSARRRNPMTTIERSAWAAPKITPSTSCAAWPPDTAPSSRASRGSLEQGTRSSSCAEITTWIFIGPRCKKSSSRSSRCTRRSPTGSVRVRAVVLLRRGARLRRARSPIRSLLFVRERA